MTRAAVVAVFILERGEILLDGSEHLVWIGEQRFEIGDGRHDLFVFIFDLLPLKARQARQTHIEDGIGLNLGEAEGADEVVARVSVGRRGANGGDDLVDGIERLEQTFENVRAPAGSFELIFGSPGGDFLPMGDVLLQGAAKAEDARVGCHVRPVRACSRRTIAAGRCA